ncbi:MAG TPA: hypothetical protein VGQ41_11760 [Pyrinomonadaceae bacterium]|nr:hypothetical protein [Pyrinomonadaceae bacterium]
MRRAAKSPLSCSSILFEAITGRKPFSGKDQIEVLNKIIREPAPPLSTFVPNAPADLQRIVRRCLAKDPNERYQNIKDVAIELKEVRREIQDGGLKYDEGIEQYKRTIELDPNFPTAHYFLVARMKQRACMTTRFGNTPVRLSLELC